MFTNTPRQRPCVHSTPPRSHSSTIPTMAPPRKRPTTPGTTTPGTTGNAGITPGPVEASSASSVPDINGNSQPKNSKDRYEGPMAAQGIQDQGAASQGATTTRSRSRKPKGPLDVTAQGLGGQTSDPGGATSISSGTSSTSDSAPQPARGKLSAAGGIDPYTELGSTGLAQYGGFVRDEFLPALQGDAGLKVWREMYDNEPVVGALVFAIQMLLRGVEWRVEPPEAASVEEIVAQRIEARQQASMRAAQAQQQQLMMAQAGLAQNAQGSSPTSMGPDGKPPKPGAPGSGSAPTPPQKAGSPFARPAGGPSPFHQGISPRQAPSPSQQSAGAGLPQSGGGNPNGQSRIRKAAHATRTLLYPFRKASSGGGGSPGGISPTDVDSSNPTDPETQEPMEFAPGLGPADPPTPAEVHNEELAVFVETCLHDMADSWADLISQIVTKVVYGFAYHELVYKKRTGPNVIDPTQGSRYDDGRIGWSKIAGRAQETRFRWEFDDSGNVLGMWQLAPPKFQLRYIPLAKALLFRTTAYKGNPEGRSLLRPAYRPWYFKRRIEEIEAIGIERDLAGLPMAYVPYQMMTPAASPAEKATLDAIKQLVRNLRRNEQEGIVFPNAIDPESKEKLYELTLMGSGSTRRQFDTNLIIQRLEQRIAMVALAEFLILGMDGMGARSLGETKVDLFTSALEALLAAIADVFNTYAIPRLMAINGEDPALSPKLTYGKLTQTSLEELASYVTALSGAGMVLFPDEQLEDYLREAGSLPPKLASNDL